jgi:very-short-patch-repair endonuclease
VHRRAGLRDEDVVEKDGIAVVTPTLTLVDLAATSAPAAIERIVNEADRLDLVAPDELRDSLRRYRGKRGVARLRSFLDRDAFLATDSELERRFLRLLDTAGLPRPLTQQWLDGHRVDFHWPAVGLVVETDGLRYHRTPAQQARDRVRDQAHAAAGRTALRFTHAQVRQEPDRVAETVAAVIARLQAARPPE